MTIARFTLLFLILAMLTLAVANNFKNPPTRTDTYDQPITIGAGAEVLDIIDGDTIRVEAYPWVGQTWTGLIRLRGIDTPELRRSKCQEEKDQGIMARNTLVSLIPPRVLLLNIENGSFGGRYIAAVMDGDSNMADVLMENGVGRPYYKNSKRKPWCNESAESIRKRHDRMKPIHHDDTPESKKSKEYLDKKFNNMKPISDTDTPASKESKEHLDKKFNNI